jgi:hypothetical protein
MKFPSTQLKAISTAVIASALTFSVSAAPLALEGPIDSIEINVDGSATVIVMGVSGTGASYYADQFPD